MSSVQLITRLISAETGLTSEKLRTGKLESHEWEQLNVKVGDLEKHHFILTTAHLYLFSILEQKREDCLQNMESN